MSQTTEPAGSAAGDAFRRLRRETTIFMLAFGVLLGAAGGFAIAKIDARAVPVWGMPRGLAIGAPVALFGLMHLISGILIIWRGSAAAALIGVAGSVLLSFFYVIWMTTVLGYLPLTLITLFIVAIPVLLGIRVAQFRRAERALRSIS